MEKVTKLIFRSKINGLMVSSLNVRKNIRSTTGNTRYDLWTLKRQLGQETRHQMLAYAFMKKIPYTCLERKVAEDNHPEPERIFMIVKGSMTHRWQRFDYWLEKIGYSQKDVNNWLAGISAEETLASVA